MSYRVLEKATKNLVGKIKDRAEKELNQSKKSGMMIMGDLQFFAAKLPENQINEYRERYKKWEKEGFGEGKEDRRIKYYSEKNLNKAFFYYKQNFKKGIQAPDGQQLNMTERDFNKLITDYKLVNKPEWIKEIILNAQTKVKQINGRMAYYSYNPSGYVVIDKSNTISAHYYGNAGKKKIEKSINRDITEGGKIEWEKS